MPEIQDIDITTTSSNEDKLHFKYLPGYATYLLNNRMEEFVSAQIRLSRELDLPILKHFASLSDEDIFKLSLKSNTDNLKIIAENKALEYMLGTLAKWKANALPMITKDQVVIEDITAGNYIRRKGYLQFLPDYTSDMEVFTGVLNELDRFIMESETQSFKMIEFFHNEESNKYVKFIEKIIQTVPSTVFIFDLVNKKEVFTNIIAKNFLGYSRQELEQKEESVLFSIIHPEDLPVLLGKFNFFSKMKEGEVITFENRARHKSGNYHWLRNYIRVFSTDEKGIPTQIIVAALDVTDEKKLAEASQQHEKQLLEAQEISRLGSFIWDLTEKKESYYTPQMYRIFEMDKFTDMAAFSEFIHPADRVRVDQAIQKAFSSKDGMYECEYRYIKDGREKIIWSRGLVSFENGKPVSMQGTIMDVTDKHQMVEQLHKSEESYHRMIDEVQDYAIILLNKNGDIQNWNKGAEKIKGYKADEIIGKNFRLFYSAEDIERKLPETLIQEAIERGKAIHEGYRVRKDGTTFWGSIVITALHDENNNVIGFSKVTRDLSERKKAEDQLASYAAKLEQKNRELERTNKELTNFNYISTHDLQEPLRKINTFSNRILETELKNLSEKGRNYFNRMQASVTRMQHLLSDLLEFSKTHSDEKHFEQSSLMDVVKKTTGELKEVIEENKVIVRYENLPVICGIKFQLHQLFNNILMNAIKYRRADAAPVITIKSSVIDSSIESFPGMDNNKRYAKISIADNGMGFDQKHAEKIFEIFQRLHSISEYEGSGIGLAICKQIMENHNGFINATSEINKGAEFNLYFPL